MGTKSGDILIKGLQSGNLQIILKTIEDAKETGDSSIVPSLIDLMIFSEHEEVRKNSKKILSEIKDKSAVDEIMNAVDDTKYADYRNQVVALCWESNLNFTPYISTFTKIVIDGDFMEAFEAMTVIENMTGVISKETADDLTNLINSAKREISDEKLNFANSILDIIEQLKG